MNEYDPKTVTDLLDLAISISEGQISIGIDYELAMKAAYQYMIKQIPYASEFAKYIDSDILNTKASTTIIVKETKEERKARKKREYEKRKALGKKYKEEREKLKQKYKETRDKLKQTCNVKRIKGKVENKAKVLYKMVCKQIEAYYKALVAQLKQIKDQCETMIPEVTATAAASGDAKNKPGFIATAATQVKNMIAACKETIQSALAICTQLLQLCANYYIPVPSAVTAVVSTLTVVAAMVNNL